MFPSCSSWIWDKLKSATKYLFGRKRKDGDFDALLLRPEDADRLAWFANYLDGGVSAIDKAVAPFGFTFCSKENVYEVALEAYQYTLNDGSMKTEYEMSVCVSIKPGNIFYRLYRTAKYLSGYCSCYGDFDSLSLCRLMLLSFIVWWANWEHVKMAEEQPLLKCHKRIFLFKQLLPHKINS